jgi:hypothetical protein
VARAVSNELHLGTHDLYLLAGELEPAAPSRRWRGAAVPREVWRHPRVSAVFRLPASALRAVEATAKDVALRARQLGVRRLQIDVDVPERLLPRAALLYERIRAQWPAADGPLHLGATFLPCHLRHREMARVLAALDEPVIQLHGIDAPRHRSDNWALMDRKTVFAALRQARRLDGRFKMALPTYAYVLTFDDRGGFRRLYAEGLSDETLLPPASACALAAPDLALLHEVLTSSWRMPVVWFRLPVEGADRWCLSRQTVALLERGERPVPSVDFSVRPTAQADVFDLVATYRHQIPLQGVGCRIDWGDDGAEGVFYPLNGARVADGSVFGRLPRRLSLAPFACGRPFVFGKVRSALGPERISFERED